MLSRVALPREETRRRLQDLNFVRQLGVLPCVVFSSSRTPAIGRAQLDQATGTMNAHILL
jgi:hypothetical protein